MRLTEMILKVAQIYTMDTVKQSTAFWFLVLVALMAQFTNVGILYESTVRLTPRFFISLLVQRMSLQLVYQSFWWQECVWEGPSWPSYWPHSASSVSVSGDSM